MHFCVVFRYESKLEEVRDLVERLRKSEETVRSLEKEIRGTASHSSVVAAPESVSQLETQLANKERELEHLRVSLRQFQVWTGNNGVDNVDDDVDECVSTVQAESNQRKLALDALGKRFNQKNEECARLESQRKNLSERDIILKDALKKAEERCLYVDRVQELLAGRTLSSTSLEQVRLD